MGAKPPVRSLVERNRSVPAWLRRLRATRSRWSQASARHLARSSIADRMSKRGSYQRPGTQESIALPMLNRVET